MFVFAFPVLFLISKIYALGPSQGSTWTFIYYVHQYLVNVSVCTIRLVNMRLKGQTILTDKPNQGEAMS